MKCLLNALVILAVSASMAWAQETVTVLTNPAPVSDVTAATCPAVATALPPLCPVLLSEDVTGVPTILVLGTEERNLGNVSRRDVNWRDATLSYSSLFEQNNPQTSIRINPAITRHGNPYAPYHLLGTRVRVAGLREQYLAPVKPASTAYPAQYQGLLQTVAMRYQGLTPAQAQALGYQPITAYTPGVGQVFLNRSLVDSCFDANTPEAFVFDQQGRLAAVQYQVVAAQPLVLFGQQMQSSQLVQGAQQSTVWLFTTNPNGLMAGSNPNLR